MTNSWKTFSEQMPANADPEGDCEWSYMSDIILIKNKQDEEGIFVNHSLGVLYIAGGEHPNEDEPPIKLVSFGWCDEKDIRGHKIFNDNIQWMEIPK